MDKRLVFVTGKGGVGKTTVAAALGLAAARRGKRTIVCEVARQERMSKAFRREGVGWSESRLAENLYAISIDPQQSLEEYLEDQIGSRRLAHLLFHNRIFEYFATAAPGVRELVTIGKVWELAQLERRRARDAPYDLVIVDAPATGHGHPAVAEALRAALWEHHRARMQHAQLDRLRRELRRGATVATLPYLFEPELGLDDFERLSEELEEAL